MNKKTLIKLSLISEDTQADCPFKDDDDTVVIRHTDNKKWFVLIFKLEGKLYVNLKCNPDLAAVLKDEYPAITSAWHMNKKHWIKVDVDNIDKKALSKLIKISYDLTAPKRKIYKVK